MLDKITALSDRLHKISLMVAAVTIGLILVITIYGAFFRYVLNTPLSWPLGVSKVLMIYCSLLGIPAALKKGQHMSVEGFLLILPRKIQLSVRYFNYTVVAVFVLVLFWYGMVEVINAKDLYMITGTTRISQKWLMASIPISAFIQFVHLLTAPRTIKEELDKSLADDYMEKTL